MADVCPCPMMPVNAWRLPDGEWFVASDIAARGIAGAEGLAADDAARYDAMGCTSWVILCPQCGRVYASGGAGRHRRP